ncbi:FAD-binding oxidoreductase [Microvirga sp. W0021]|uniref:FAD-binding oxidoreductase n=1 Tax=Hohaiivirga grylli TaxID=3133970 RepID=A0ABV0BLI9_9HYPH
MPSPRSVPVIGDETLPEKVDVVVIGGGIIGCSTALELAERGLKVAVCEKGNIGREQSGQNWGWVRIGRRDSREVPLMAEALRLWPELEKRTGHATGYNRCGIVFSCTSDAEYARYEAWLENLKGLDVDSRMISAGEYKKLFPGNTLDVKGGHYTPDDGCAEPQLATAAIAEGARAKGCYILTECAVRGLETTAGQVSAVVTERGTIACQAIVLAGGAWSSLFLGSLGVRLPQLRVLNSVLRTEPLEGGPDTTLWTWDFAARKRKDGGYTIASGQANLVDVVPKSFSYFIDYLPTLKHEWRALSLRFSSRFFEEARIPNKWALNEESPFEYHRSLDPVPSRKILDRAFEAACRTMPVFRKTKVAQRWGGYIDTVPDAVPVISPIEKIPGLFVATGFSGHGFGIGPAAGRLMANLVTGEKPLVDPHNFRLSRFSDGTKTVVECGF